MKSVLSGVVFVLLLVSHAFQNALAIQSREPIKPKVIYGDDNRKNLFEITDPLQLKIADGTVALFSSKMVSIDAANDNAYLITFAYKTAYGLCSGERFENERVGAFCSGFLVDESTVVTAGHCIKDQTECNSTRFVFGFSIENAEFSTPHRVDANDVYKCRSIAGRRSLSQGPDFAVIKLDRPVKNHSPVSLNRSGYLASDAPLAVIGHPAGLATKVADNATVRSVGIGPYFTTNTDSYVGNSGSAVINEFTGEVEGILVQGEADFVRKGVCYVSKTCSSQECTGERATKISYVLNYIGK